MSDLNQLEGGELSLTELRIYVQALNREMLVLAKELVALQTAVSVLVANFKKEDGDL